jgi:hypothetical protein
LSGEVARGYKERARASNKGGTMTRTSHPRLALWTAVVLLTAAAGTRAQTEGEAQATAEAAKAQEQLDRTPADCVLMNRVSRNVGVNDHQVVFFMRGNTYYLNNLDAACVALTKGADSLVFAYRTRSAKITRLCETDSFTVERQTSRLGCGLGQFVPITAEEASALTGRPLPAPAAASTSGNDQRGGSSRREIRN